MHQNRQLSQKWTKFDKLTFLVEAGLEKLNHSLDVLLSTQKEISKFAGILEF